MTGAQLELSLAPRKAPARNRPAIERLHAVLKREGFRLHPFSPGGGSVLLRPLLAGRCGYQPTCGRYCCGDLTFERVDYFEREPLTPDERREWAQWREQVWRVAFRELWGDPR